MPSHHPAAVCIATTARKRPILVVVLSLVMFALVGCGAYITLVTATYFTRGLVLSGTLAVLFLASLGACFLGGAWRVFAAGFTLCGWGYLLLQYGPFLRTFEYRAVLPGYAPSLRDSLITTQLLDQLHVKVCRSVPIKDWSLSESDKVADAFELVPTYIAFMDIGHSLWALLFGIVGGFTALYLSRSCHPLAIQRGA